MRILLALLFVLIVACAPNPAIDFLEEGVDLSVRSMCSNLQGIEKDNCLLRNCPDLKTTEGRDACCQTIKDDSIKLSCLNQEDLEAPASISGEGPDVVDGYVTIKGSIPALNEGETYSIYLEKINEGGKFSELPDAMYTFCRGIGFEGKCFDSEQTNGIFAKKTLIASSSWELPYPPTEFEEKSYVGDSVEYRVIYTLTSESADDTKLKEYANKVEGPFHSR